MLVPKIPLPKKLSEKIARFSTQKIDPATGVKMDIYTRWGRNLGQEKEGEKSWKLRVAYF